MVAPIFRSDIAKQGTVVDAQRKSAARTRSHANHRESKTFDNAVEKTNNVSTIQKLHHESEGNHIFPYIPFFQVFAELLKRSDERSKGHHSTYDFRYGS